MTMHLHNTSADLHRLHPLGWANQDNTTLEIERVDCPACLQWMAEEARRALHGVVHAVHDPSNGRTACGLQGVYFGGAQDPKELTCPACYEALALR